MINRFLPSKVYNTVFDIKLDFLKENNIKALIFDIDDTLVAHDVETPTKEVVDFLNGFIEKGIKVSLISNGKRERVCKFNKDLKLFAYHRALKPRKKALKKAMASMKSSPKTTALVGDQLFTDIYGGNRAGLFTILVTPIKPDETKFIMIKRKMEKKVLKNIKEK